MFTSESHPIRVDFIEPEHHGLPGRLGLTIAPGKKDDRWHRDLETDLSRLREEYNTGLLVSLMEGHEYEALRIEELLERAVQHGIDVVRFPIRDVSVPPADAMPRCADLIDQVVAAMRSGRTVVVHCRGGLGRSGVVAGCAPTALGMDPSQAITRVREARPGAVETRAQEAWVNAFRAHLAETGALTPALGRKGHPAEIRLLSSDSHERPDVAKAATGDFLAVPLDLTTHELSYLAHLLNGYDIATEHADTDASNVRDLLRERFRATGRWEGSTVELLAGFFMVVRGWRWACDFPTDGSDAHREALGIFEALQQRLQSDPGEVIFLPAKP